MQVKPQSKGSKIMKFSNIRRIIGNNINGVLGLVVP